MNWEVVGAVATVLGVIGGLVSLYFLIHEVRRNAQAIEGATVQSLMNFEQAVYALLIDNAAVFLDGCADRDGLAPDARFKFDKLVQAYMSLYYSAFEQHENGLIDGAVWDAYRNAIRDKMQKPGFAASWQDISTSYPVGFQKALGPGQAVASADINGVSHAARS